MYLNFWLFQIIFLLNLLILLLETVSARRRYGGRSYYYVRSRGEYGRSITNLEDYRGRDDSHYSKSGSKYSGNGQNGLSEVYDEIYNRGKESRYGRSIPETIEME